MLVGRAFPAGDEFLLAFKLEGKAAHFGIEVGCEVVEEGLDGLALLIAQFALVVGLQTLSIESENSAYLPLQVPLEQKMHVLLQHFHEGSAFYEHC